MTVRLATITDKSSWNSIATHPLQLWEWGDFRTKTNAEVLRIVETKNENITQVYQSTLHRIPYTSWKVGYIPKCQAPSSGVLEYLISYGKRHHIIYFQIEPNILHSDMTALRPHPKLHISAKPLFTKYTYTLDLTKSENELLSSMHQKTRYNIRLAKKKGVQIQEDSSSHAFSEYLRLTEETTRRQKFYAHDTNYHTNMWNCLHKDKYARLFTATYDGMILAAWIIFCHNKTIYYPYGASSTKHRNVMAPNLLLWEIALWGKKEGYTTFDLWGALGPNADPNDPWYGFHRFKAGYNPSLVEFAGSFDLRVNTPLYHAFTLANSMRWFLLKAKKKLQR